MPKATTAASLVRAAKTRTCSSRAGPVDTPDGCPPRPLLGGHLRHRRLLRRHGGPAHPSHHGAALVAPARASRCSSASTVFVAGELGVGRPRDRRARRAGGAAGVGLLYKGLAVGQMSVVAPITALLSAAVPVVAGYVEGERPGGHGRRRAWPWPSWPSSWCRPRAAAACDPPTCARCLYALGAGLGFGFFFVFLSHTGEDAGMWPLVAARVRVGGRRRERRAARLHPAHAPDPRQPRSSPPPPAPSTPSPTSSTSSPCGRVW